MGLLVDYGHRLGLRAHVSDKERKRAYLAGTVGDLLSEDEQRAYVPLIAPGDAHTLESIDCIWYLRGKATFLFEVEWTAMVTDALLRRGPRIPSDETIVRFLVIPPERVELLRLKLARSPLLRQGDGRAKLAYPQGRSSAPIARAGRRRASITSRRCSASILKSNAGPSSCRSSADEQGGTA